MSFVFDLFVSQCQDFPSPGNEFLEPISRGALGLIEEDTAPATVFSTAEIEQIKRKLAEEAEKGSIYVAKVSHFFYS